MRVEVGNLSFPKENGNMPGAVANYPISLGKSAVKCLTLQTPWNQSGNLAINNSHRNLLFLLYFWFVVWLLTCSLTQRNNWAFPVTGSHQRFCQCFRMFEAVIHKCLISQFFWLARFQVCHFTELLCLLGNLTEWLRISVVLGSVHFSFLEKSNKVKGLRCNLWRVFVVHLWTPWFHWRICCYLIM